jgi:hypothetical protein
MENPDMPRILTNVDLHGDFKDFSGWGFSCLISKVFPAGADFSANFKDSPPKVAGADP